MRSDWPPSVVGGTNCGETCWILSGRSVKTPDLKRVKPERSEAGGEKTKVISYPICVYVIFLVVNFEENKGGCLVYMILEWLKTLRALTLWYKRRKFAINLFFLK